MRWLAVLLFLGLWPGELRGTEHLLRRYGADAGLPNLWVHGLAQDAEGFLWIVTHGTLVRFDGTRMVRIQGGMPFDKVRTNSSGSVVGFRDQLHPLYELRTMEAVPIHGPKGSPLLDVVDYQFARDGTLWVLQGGALHHLHHDGSWTSRGLDFLNRGKETARRLQPHGASGMFVCGKWSVWRIAGVGRKAEKIYRRAHHVPVWPKAWDRPDGGVLFGWLGDSGNTLLSLGEAPEREIFSINNMSPSMVVRDGTLWICDTRLMRLTNAGKIEVVYETDPTLDAAALLADREGSLWIGSSRGLLQIPSVDSVIWGLKDGLPSNFARFLTRNDEGVWVGTWHGLGSVLQKDGEWTASRHATTHGHTCLDAKGVLWGGPEARLGGRWLPWGHVQTGPCAVAPDGTVWMGEDRLLHTSSQGGPPRQHESPIAQIRGLIAGNKELWISGTSKSGKEVVCQGAADQSGNWRCDTIPAAEVRALVRAPSGAVWAASREGIFRWAGNGWSLMPDVAELNSPDILSLKPGSEGTVWIGGASVAVRVREKTGDDGFTVVETLSGWNGLPPGLIVTDILEEPDGGLWVATSDGVVRIPEAARRRAEQAPRIRIMAMSVDGAAQPLLDMAAIPGRGSVLELEFAAATYRDRGLLRYQHRVGRSGEWRTVRAGEGTLRLAELRHGRHEVALRASLNGVEWSEAVKVNVEVAPEWYMRSWVIGLGLGGAMGLAFFVHRTRMEAAVAAERQRVRIAQDLHDDIGSMLGSIGILSSLAASNEVAEGERLQLAQRIAETSAEAGTALQEIVRSLGRNGGSLEEAARLLARKARDLFPGPRPNVSICFPDPMPRVRLAGESFRNLVLIGQEALHNAARHSRALSIELRLEKEERQWALVVTDDGVGIGDGEGNGLGLESMRMRALGMKGAAEWLPGKPSGTEFRLRFPAGEEQA